MVGFKLLMSSTSCFSEMNFSAQFVYILQSNSIIELWIFSVILSIQDRAYQWKCDFVKGGGFFYIYTK